jgi:hypothetical protein
MTYYDILQVYWYCVTATALRSLSKQCPYLQKLDLSWCGDFNHIKSEDFVEWVLNTVTFDTKLLSDLLLSSAISCCLCTHSFSYHFHCYIALECNWMCSRSIMSSPTLILWSLVSSHSTVCLETALPDNHMLLVVCITCRIYSWLCCGRLTAWMTV